MFRTVLLFLCTPSLLATPVAAAAPPPGAAAKRVLVVCAPGYPGTTLEAQATMDGFAAATAQAAGWKAGDLGAVYHETLKGGVERLAAADAAVALVTLPVYLQEGARLGLNPRLMAVLDGGASESWGLVARKGAVRSAADLDGWEITGSVGYSAPFVRGPLLGAWGTLPPSVRITFAPAALSALRRTAAGEKLAVLLDQAGMAALPGLPFSSDLEVVARSAPLPGSLLCTVGGRLPPRDADRLVKGLGRMPQSPEGAAALKAIRVLRFEPADRAALDRARRAFDAVTSSRASQGDRP